MRHFLFSLLLIGILSSSAWAEQPKIIAPVCRHKALYAAVTAGEQYNVRLVVGVLRGIDPHVEAQAFIAGEWVFAMLRSSPSDPGKLIISFEKDPPELKRFRIDKVWTISYYLDTWKALLIQESMKRLGGKP